MCEEHAVGEMDTIRTQGFKQPDKSKSDFVAPTTPPKDTLPS